MKIDKISEDITKEVTEKQAEIIDLFVKTFIVSRMQDYFYKKIKDGKMDFRRIKLVQKIEGQGKVTWKIELTKGRLKKLDK